MKIESFLMNETQLTIVCILFHTFLILLISQIHSLHNFTSVIQPHECSKHCNHTLVPPLYTHCSLKPYLSSKVLSRFFSFGCISQRRQRMYFLLMSHLLLKSLITSAMQCMCCQQKIGKTQLFNFLLHWK